VQRKKRKMNIGEAFVGMKRRGSQLEHILARAARLQGGTQQTFLDRTSSLFLADTLK